MNALIILGIYVIGFLITLITLHEYGKQFGLDCYDPPHDDYYDDYSSNAQAYLAFSVIWIIFVPINILFWIGRVLEKFSIYVGRNINK